MKNKNIFWGVLFIAIACFLIIDQTGVLKREIGVWSIILGIVMVGCFVDGIKELNYLGIFVPLAVLWHLFGSLIHLPEISCWYLILAAVCLSIGCSMLFPKKGIKRKFIKGHGINDSGQNCFQSSEGNTDQDIVYCYNRFGELVKYVNTGNFQSANLDNCFGEMKVYFDGASIQQDSAEIKVSLAFGETQLFIPKEWNVKNTVGVVFADVAEANARMENEGPTVYITGNVSFGELQIIYV